MAVQCRLKSKPICCGVILGLGMIYFPSHVIRGLRIITTHKGFRLLLDWKVSEGFFSKTGRNLRHVLTICLRNIRLRKPVVGLVPARPEQKNFDRPKIHSDCLIYFQCSFLIHSRHQNELSSQFSLPLIEWYYVRLCVFSFTLMCKQSSRWKKKNGKMGHPAITSINY